MIALLNAAAEVQPVPFVLAGDEGMRLSLLQAISLKLIGKLLALLTKCASSDFCSSK